MIPSRMETPYVSESKPPRPLGDRADEVYEYEQDYCEEVEESDD